VGFALSNIDNLITVPSEMCLGGAVGAAPARHSPAAPARGPAAWVVLESICGFYAFTQSSIEPKEERG